MMKWTLLALVTGAAGAYGAWSYSACSCDGESGAVVIGQYGDHSGQPGSVKPEGIYLEARDATVWGGACHISAEAATGGRRAALGWSFTGGRHGGVDLAGAQVVAVVEGTSNLQAAEVFGTDEVLDITSQLWIDAPSAVVRDAAIAFVQGMTDLGEILDVHTAEVTLDYEADQFVMGVDGALSVKGEAMADRSCCTMPESRWYSPLADVGASVVGNPSECRFEGVAGSLDRWAFEGENSVFVASLTE